MVEFYHERGFAVSRLGPEQFPVQPARLESLAGGDREVNARIVRGILAGEERGPRRDAVLLNAAAALLVAARARTLTDGWELAGELIDSGKARAKLREIAPGRG